MNYEKQKDKYVFEKEGVYFALTLEQVDDMETTLAEIQKKERSKQMSELETTVA